MTNTLSTSINNGIKLTSGGSFQSPFTITAAGTIVAGTIVTGNGHDGVYSAYGTPTLVNYGLVQAGPVGTIDGYGVQFQSPGDIINHGTIIGGSRESGASSGGTGVLQYGGTLTNFGTIIGGSGGLFRDDGVEIISGATVDNHGTIIGGSGGRFGGNGIYLSNDTNVANYNVTNFNDFTGGNGLTLGGYGAVVGFHGTLTNTSSGTINGGYGATLGGAGVYIKNGTLLNSGVIIGGVNDNGARTDAVLFSTYASGIGTLVVEAGASFEGSVVANSTIADVLAIGGTSAVSLIGLGSEYQNFRILAFESGATGTVSGTYSAFSGLNVTSFALGDTLVLDGFAEGIDLYLKGTGLVLGNGSSSQITLDITGSFTTSDFTVVDSSGNSTISLNSMPCFAAGTRILTTRGETQVEQMREGMQVILADERIVPVTWIGHRTVDIAGHPHPETVRPVLIMAGAISNGVPARDLLISPDHAVALNGHLIPAKALINGSTIRQIDRRTITYYHVELPEHAVLLAEGTPCESYLETGNRHNFENGDAPVIALHPAFGPTTPDWQRVREARSCAPLVEDGPVVEAVRARLLSRADIATTQEADLAIIRRTDGSIVLTSRSTIPGHLSPDPRDRRLLGVKIASIMRKDGTFIPLDHPDLNQGWHDAEPDGRWTDGHALIPASLLGDGPPDITLAATLAYPADRNQAARQPRFGS